MQKTPLFWYKAPGIISFILKPISWLYQLGHKTNQAFIGSPYKSSIPVICIGNAIAGGGGKTPTVIALTKLLKQSGYNNIHILTRGYGSKNDTPLIVNAEKHSAQEVGDEPLLLSRIAETIVAKNRSEGAKLAQENNADIIIMDDGFFNNTLYKDISFLVIDRQIDFGNGKLIPAGPLREPLSNVLSKTDAVICIGPKLLFDKDIFAANIQTDTKPQTDKKYIGFAGLALPDKLKNTLIDNDYNLVGWHAFADHHPYKENEIEQLIEEARSKDAILITTEKDFVRIPSAYQARIETLPITLEFDNGPALVDLIKDKTNDKP